MDRRDIETGIDSLFGLPGSSPSEDDELATRAIIAVVREMGADAFTDEALRKFRDEQSDLFVKSVRGK